MARTVPEWIGKTDDHRAPGSVRDRIRLAHKCCNICGLPFKPGAKSDLDHVTALINGGENRESNLRPVHTKCHKEKTAADVAEKAKVAAIRQKHHGIKPVPKKPLRSAPFPPSEHSLKRQPKTCVVNRPSLYEAKP